MGIKCSRLNALTGPGTHRPVIIVVIPYLKKTSHGDVREDRSEILRRCYVGLVYRVVSSSLTAVPGASSISCENTVRDGV